MDANSEGKRKKDRGDDEDERRREKKSKRARTRSRSPAERRDRDSQRKRKRSRSRSPGKDVKQEKEKEPEVKAEPPVRRAKETDMLNTRTGGAYIPPARLRMMQAQITDKSSVAYQRLAWEALKKSIHGHINKINIGNIGIIIKELLKENIVRGRGLLCRSVIQAQAASPTFTNVYAALVAAVNSRFPNIGELLLKRLVIQFKRGFKRNDKPICISSASFIAHLVNQRVAHEILALELLTLLVETPTDDSVEVSISFLKECGQKLTEVSSKGVNAIFEMLRNILHEGQLDKRVQYMIEVMFQVWKDGFKDHPALIEELELVPEEEQFTHLLMLDDGTDPQDILNVFKFDEKYEENEQKYKTLSKEILGSDAESGEEDGSGESGSEESDDEEQEENAEQKNVTIIDNTETNLIALRRTIYLTINSSLDFEECAHKLMKMELKPGQEVELCHMFLDCCAEQRTYEKFYGLLAQRFCNINRIYIGPFEEIFKDSYSTAHRLDTNRLRNVSKFFAHLLFTDSISWEVLECVKLNEEDTTSSSRIYIKILFQELAEYMGLKKLNDRLKDPTLQSAFSGVFPRDNPKNTRFSINFFTSIGLGGLTDELREHLKQMPKNVPPAEITVGSSSSSDSSSSSSSSSDTSSDSSSSDSESEEEKSKKKKKDKKKSKQTKTPKTPENEPQKDKTERWGHDGFYDTYGKDAQRHENPRNQRDKDNFAIPRDVPRKRVQRNGDDRRRIDEEDPRNRRNEDDRRDRNYDGRNSDGRRDMERSERNRNDERRERDRVGDRSDRSRYDERKERDEERSGRDRNDDRRERGSDDERHERNREYERRDRDDSRRDRRERIESERDSGYESKSKRHDEDRVDREKSRNNDKPEKDRKRDRDDEPRERTRNDREKGDDYEKDKKNDKKSRKEKNKDSDDSSDEEQIDREKSRSNEKPEKDRKRDRDEEPRERTRNDREKGDDYEKDKKKDKKSRKEKNKDSDDSSDEEQIDREKSRKDDRREKDRNGRERGREEDPRERSRDDRNKEDDYEKEKKKSRKEKEKAKDSDEGSDEEDTKSYREKDRRRDDDYKNKRKDKENDDGWDIIGSSVRRDVGGRFWDSYEGKKRETLERSPERKERKSEKNRRDR